MDHYVKIFFDNAHCVASFTLLSQRTILLHTRMHSGRMRTARSSSCPERRGLHSPWEQTPLPGSRPPRPDTPHGPDTPPTRHPWTRLPDQTPPGPDTPLGPGIFWDQTPPQTEFLTHASETRMHSSRMHTGCSLTVCQGVPGPGRVPGPGGAWSRGGAWSQGGMVLGGVPGPRGWWYPSMH